MSFRRHKYGVSPKAERTVDGITFASKKEAQRWGELKLLEQAGRITDLRRQPRWKLEVNGVHIAEYVADFWYQENGKAVVEDVKGMRESASTAWRLYRMKRDLLLAIYGIAVTEP